MTWCVGSQCFVDFIAINYDHCGRLFFQGTANWEVHGWGSPICHMWHVSSGRIRGILFSVLCVPHDICAIRRACAFLQLQQHNNRPTGPQRFECTAHCHAMSFHFFFSPGRAVGWCEWLGMFRVDLQNAYINWEFLRARNAQRMHRWRSAQVLEHRIGLERADTQPIF